MVPFFTNLSPLFLSQGISLRLGWLANGLQESICLCFPKAGITDTVLPRLTRCDISVNCQRYLGIWYRLGDKPFGSSVRDHMDCVN